MWFYSTGDYHRTVDSFYESNTVDDGVDAPTYFLACGRSSTERNSRYGIFGRTTVQDISYGNSVGSPYRTLSVYHRFWDVEERITNELILGDTAVDTHLPGIFFSCTFKYLAATNLFYQGSPY